LISFLISIPCSSQRPELVLPIGQSGEINFLCFSPNGKLALSNTRGGSSNLLDINKRKLLCSYSVADGCGLCFSPDNKYLLLSDKGKIRIWDLLREEIYKIIEVPEFLTSYYPNHSQVCISLDGRYIYYGSNDSKMIMFDIQKNRVYRYFKGHTSNIDLIRFFPDGKQILTGSNDKSMKLWDAGSGKLIKSFTGDVLSFGIKSISISQDGERILSMNYDKNIGLWNVKTGKIERSFDGRQFYIHSVCFDPDGKNVLLGTEYNKILLLNIKTGKLTKYFEEFEGWPTSLCFSPDGRNLLFSTSQNEVFLVNIPLMKIEACFKGNIQKINAIDCSPDSINIASGNNFGQINIWNIKYGKLLNSIRAHEASINSIHFSPNHRFICSCSDDKSIREIDLTNGKEIRRIKRFEPVLSICYSHDGKLLLMGLQDISSSFEICHIDSIDDIKSFHNVSFVNSVSFSSDDQLALSGSDNKAVKLWNVITRKEIRSFEGHAGGITSVCFSPDGHYLLSGSEDNSIKLWNSQSGNEIQSFNGHSSTVTSVCFSPDGRYVLSGSWDNTLKLWDLQNGDAIKTFEGHNDFVSSVCFSRDGRYAISGSCDKTIKLWDILSGQEVVTLIAVDSNDYLIVTPDQYYLCSKNANTQLNWRIGLDLYGFDQFDLQYNRPDIVLERIGYAPKELIESYRKAYYKRLKKMNFNESMFSPEFHTPEIEILNKNDLKLTTDYRAMPIKIKASDDKYHLDRINLWVNDIPVYGMNGMNLRGLDKDSLVSDIIVNLSQGENKIQVSCLNEKGVESLKETFEIRYEPEEPEKANVYFVGIGVSDYNNERLDLTYSVKDIQDLASLFKAKYPEILVDTLFNAHVTRQNAINLKKELSRTKIDDEVILALSGHGFLSDSLDFYYGTYDIDYRHPEIKGLSYDDIEWLLDSIPARKKLVLMDACHSGEVDKEILESKADIQLAEHVKPVPNKKGTELLLDSTSFGLQNSFELMQELFTNLSKGNGAVVISAAGGLEYAYEGPDWKNGVFTYSVRKGLEGNEADLNGDKTVTVNELKDYLFRQVETLTGGKQKPTSRRENLENDWRIW